MFDLVDQKLEAWVRGIAGTVDVCLGIPGEERSASGVGLYLLELCEDPPHRGAQPPPLRLALRYLVTTWGEPSSAHRTLGELAFAALADPDLRVDLTPLPAPLWAALGTAPRPAFVLRCPVQRERDFEPAPPVVHEMKVRAGPLVSLEGLLTSPEGVPLAGASVSVPRLGKQSITDGRGAFRLSGLPAPVDGTQLLVRARGRERVVTIRTDSTDSDAGPITILVDLQEERA